MGKVIIKAISGPAGCDGDNYEDYEGFEDFTNLSALHGISCPDDFVEYIHNEKLKSKLKSGYIPYMKQLKS